MDKKQYETPELVVHGSVEDLTQFFGNLGSGDYFTSGTGWGEGCLTEEGYFCENPASTGSAG